MTNRVVQLTDLHLFADPGGELMGVRTDESLGHVLSAVRALDPAPDLVLLTGDLSQDESQPAYERLANAVQELGPPVRWIPGNHDDVDLMERSLIAERVAGTRVHRVGAWQIVLLSSQRAGHVEGWIAPRELDLLARELADAERSSRHALVALHHPAFPVGAEWIDAQSVTNADELLHVLASSRAVRGVVCGHVHQEKSWSFEGIPFWSTPSTCFQFAPGRADFALDPRAPGFRVLDLEDDGTIATNVERVDAAYQEASRAPGY